MDPRQSGSVSRGDSPRSSYSASEGYEEEIKHPVYDFISAVEAVLAECNQHAANQGVLPLMQDDLKFIRTDIAEIKALIADLNSDLQDNEEARQNYTITEGEAEAIERAESDVRAASKALQRFRSGTDVKIKGLMFRQSEINKSIQIEILNSNKDQGEAIQEYNTKTSALNRQVVTLRRDIDDLKDEIRSSCCFCLPSCAKEPKEKLRARREDLGKVLEDLAKLDREKSGRGRKKKEVVALERERDAVTTELEKIEREKVGKEAKLERKKEQAETRLATLRAEKQEEEKNYYSALSKEAICNVVRIYVKLILLKESVHSAKTDMRGTKYEARITAINDCLSRTRGNYDDRMNTLWCPKTERKTAAHLYQAYRLLRQAEKDDFMSARPSNGVMDKVLLTDLLKLREMRDQSRGKPSHRESSRKKPNGSGARLFTSYSADLPPQPLQASGEGSLRIEPKFT